MTAPSVGVARRRFAAAGALALALCLLVPRPAYADIAGDINSWLCGLLRDLCNWIFSAQVDVLSGIGYDGVLSSAFDSMLGTAGGDVTMHDVARGVWEAAILPIGCGVLSLSFTVQLIHVSQRMEGDARVPGVREVVFLLVFFAVFLFLVQHSFDLMGSVYEVVRLAIRRVTDLFGAGGSLDLTEVSIVTTEDDVASLRWSSRS